MSLVRATDAFLAFEQLPANAGFFVSKEKFGKQDFFNAFDLKQAERAEQREAVHRLVKASKSPTSLDSVFEREKKRFEQSFFVEHHKEMLLQQKPAIEVEQKKQITPHGVAGCAAVVQYREWAQEWRIRSQVEATSGILPPSQEGERISELLSARGAKKIAESCEYMSLKKGGYKTFVTGTFNEEIRAKIKSGETSIQKEVSRCMDALQKMYQRGWVTDTGEKVDGKNEALCYCWVVEIPVNENYEENPHVHMLLGWSVPFSLFAAWSARIERIWKNGYFHLEKIKDCTCAGAYMAKAAGYMTKAQGDESQGKVRGNRYGISEPARAPDWVTIGKSQLHSMGQIIADVYDHLTLKHGHKFRLRKALNEELERTPKTAKSTREKIGKQLAKVREELKKIPVRCNKYQIILKGREVAGTFITWAKGEPLMGRPDWLPELPADLAWKEGEAVTAKDSQFFKVKFKRICERFKELKRKRHAFTNEMCAFFVEKIESFKNEAFSGWSEYEALSA